MKKNLLLLATFALLAAGSIRAQHSYSLQTTPGAATAPESQAPWHADTNADGTVEWSYFNGSPNSWSGLGTGQASRYTFSVAIRIPADSPLAGKTIKSIKAPVLVTEIENIKVWIRSALTGANLVNMTLSQPLSAHSFAEATLSEDFVIPETGVYVGYTFTSASQYPIAIAGSSQPNGLFLKMGASPWGDLSNEGYGVSPLQLTLAGDFPQNAAKPEDFGDHFVQVSKSSNVPVRIVNNGQEPVRSIDYVVVSNGVAAAEQHINLSTPISGLLSSASVSIPFEGAAEVGTEEKTITITKVNGVANEWADASASGRLITVEKLLTRNFVVEEFTGTGCGYCPRGIAGMQILRNKYGDRFVGIGIHQYNGTDAMYFPAYPSLGFTGAPSCMIDRSTGEIDPLPSNVQDLLDRVDNELSQPVGVAVSVEGLWNADSTAVDATAYIESLVDDSGYQIEYVLIADDLTGTGSAWNQSNYYSSSAPAGIPELDRFCAGGQYGQSSVVGLHFNDVGIATSYINGVNKATPPADLTAGSVSENSFTLSLPTKEPLAGAIQKDKVFVAALLVKDGVIVNASKSLVVGNEETAIRVHTADAKGTEVARYTADGQLVSAPVKGLNLVRMSDGTTKKVFVR